MAETAERTGCSLSVAQVLRSWDAYTAQAGRLRANRERLHTLTLWRRQPRPDWSDGNWLADRRRSGGILYDLAVHDVDYVTGLFGPPERVEASLGPDGESVDPLSPVWEFLCGDLRLLVSADRLYLRAGGGGRGSLYRRTYPV